MIELSSNLSILILEPDTYELQTLEQHVQLPHQGSLKVRKVNYQLKIHFAIVQSNKSITNFRLKTYLHASVGGADGNKWSVVTKILYG